MDLHTAPALSPETEALCKKKKKNENDVNHFQAAAVSLASCRSPGMSLWQVGVSGRKPGVKYGHIRPPPSPIFLSHLPPRGPPKTKKEPAGAVIYRD